MYKQFENKLIPVENNFKSQDFQKEWNEMERLGVDGFIFNFFKGMTLKTQNGHIKSWTQNGIIDKIFGFAYTSSSGFAMISACNNDVYIDDDYYINCIVLKNGSPVLIVQNDNENEKHYRMELD